MEEFRTYLTKKYGADAAESVHVTLPVTPASLRDAEAQAAQFQPCPFQPGPARFRTGGSGPESGRSSFRGHAVQSKKKVGQSADLWGLIGKFERLHFERENARLAREAEGRKLEYRRGLETQIGELNARRHAQVLAIAGDRRRMETEQSYEKKLRTTEEETKARMRGELREFMASEEKRKWEKVQKKKLREQGERARILEIMEAECAPGSEMQAWRLNRKKEDPRAPWEKEEGGKTGDVQGFCEGLDAQVRAKREERERQKEAREAEKKVLDEDAERARQEEKNEREKRVRHRKEVDKVLIQQMSEMFPLTKDQKMNRDGKNKDLIINQPLVRLMAQEPDFLHEQDKQLLK